MLVVGGWQTALSPVPFPSRCAAFVADKLLLRFQIIWGNFGSASRKCYVNLIKVKLKKDKLRQINKLRLKFLFHYNIINY